MSSHLPLYPHRYDPYQRVLLAVFVITGAVFALHCVVWLSALSSTLNYPYELNYTEGWLLYQAQRIKEGLALYGPFAGPPSMVIIYTPVYLYVTAWISGLGIDPLAAGRGVSFAATLVTAVFMAMIIVKTAPAQCSRRIAYLIAVVTVLFYVRSYCIASWSMMMRVDMLALSVEMIGLYCFLYGRDRWRIFAAGIFFVLAAYTKQSIAAAAIACFLYEAMHNYKRALLFAGGMVLFAGGIFGIAAWQTHGLFFVHHVLGNIGEFGWGLLGYQIQIVIKEQAFTYFVTLLFAAAAVGIALQKQENESGERRRSVTVLSLFYFTSLALNLFTSAKYGSDSNALLEFTGANLILFALAASHILATPSHVPLRRDSLLLLYKISLPLALFFQAGYAISAIKHRELHKSYDMTLNAHANASRKLVDWLKHIENPVISEDVVALYRAGKPLFYQPFEMTQIAVKQHAWNPQILVEMLKQGQICGLAFVVDLESPLRTGSFTQEMIEAIRMHYTRKPADPPFYLYEPRVPAANCRG